MTIKRKACIAGAFEHPLRKAVTQHSRMRVPATFAA